MHQALHRDAGAADSMSLQHLAWRVLGRSSDASRRASAAHQPSDSVHQADASERDRQAAAWAAGDRLANLYERAGRPSNWLTRAVWMAEAAVEWRWLEARETGSERQFRAAVDDWEHAAAVAIRAAGEAAACR